MIKQTAFVQIITSIVMLTFTAHTTHAQFNENADDKHITITKDISLEQIAPNAWIHTTILRSPQWGRVPCNGLIVKDGNEALMIDTPCYDRETGILFDWAEHNLNATIKHVIVTHSHIDCMGGIAEAHRRNALSYALDKTAEFAKRDGNPPPKIAFKKSYSLKCGNLPIQIQYLGGGHTVDNIVVWLPRQQILFGGCMVKAVNSRTLGYTDEADIPAWPKTLTKVLDAFPNAKLVIPGHGAHGGMELIEHTIQLCEEE